MILGKPHPLVGVLSEPEHPPPATRPCVVVLNAGLVHRVGPHRIMTRLTRALCGHGFYALRFDLSGVGDSPARSRSTDFQAGTVQDIRAVFDDLQTRLNVQSFVLTGICSGADDSLAAAVDDERVVGIVPIDGVAYRTPAFYAHHYGSRLLDPGRVLRYCTRQLRRAIAPLSARQHPGEPIPTPNNAVPYERVFEPRAAVSHKLQILVERGVRMYWIYTAGMPRYYNHEHQFREMFRSVDFRDQLRHSFYSHVNHTFTELASQKLLIDSVSGWLLQNFNR